MPAIRYKQARPGDIPGTAQVRAADWGKKTRISQYLAHQANPYEGLGPRASALGSILAWYWGGGVALGLLQRLTKQLLAHDVRRICVDVEPANELAGRF